ncbi:hypothetical protein PQO03_03725 [Lentisphaera profundi]|uniref:Transcription factor zinc-finger domain-containing protein n=1 Tax=Lentisphaera profundi TaxID=1658616 RepID=A0ABY7VUT8_9BACT|nr:hypothetical protein [Lentisphaera profundi]WDE97064.1 hypothetical protein PQO03_03725 [Lentisphaera profundi]
MSNCQNCGAALPPNNSVCTYCETRNFVDFNSYEKVGAQTQMSQRKCSLCKSIMETIDVGATSKSLQIEKCNACHSLFFDNGEVELMLEMYGKDPLSINRQRLQNLCELAVESGDRKAYIPCPVCQQLMNKQLFGAKSAVVVDICHDHGLFFEPGEIRHLIEWKRAGGKILDENVKASTPKQKIKRTPSSHEFDMSNQRYERNGGFLGSAIEMFIDIFN